MGFFSQAFLIFLMKESKKRRRKQPGKLNGYKSCSQPVNLPATRPYCSVCKRYLLLIVDVLLVTIRLHCMEVS